ncbi:nucleotidyltransferase substrate binding protein [Candidatus Hydrogenedentota bacterium]
MDDVRWMQRFDNYEKAFTLLHSALEDKPLDGFSDLEQEGLAQRFEYTFELAWKTMKDYMEENGLVISPVTPRNVIKEAFAAGIVGDGQLWIDMMLHRNLLSHAYDKKAFNSVLEAVSHSYLSALAQLREWFVDKRQET